MSYGKVAFVPDEVRSCQEIHRVFVGEWCGEQPSIMDATRNAERASGCVRAVPDGTPYSALRLLPKRCAVASSANPPPPPFPLLLFFADACGRAFASQHLCKGMWVAGAII